MELFETLKQFKAIQPNPATKEISKRAILATLPREPLSARKVLLAVIETGLAVGLAGFFILLATGQLGTEMPYGGSPAQFSVINPDALRAEAQAVDMQIQLAQLSYQESTTTIDSTSLTAAPINTETLLTTAALMATTTPAATEPSGDAQPSSTISIDQALEQLAK